MSNHLTSSNIEILYNSVPDVEFSNKIFGELKIFFCAYIKGKFPSISALCALKEKKLIQIEEDRLNNLLFEIELKMKDIDKSKIDYDFIRKEEFA